MSQSEFDALVFSLYVMADRITANWRAVDPANRGAKDTYHARDLRRLAEELKGSAGAFVKKDRQ